MSAPKVLQPGGRWHVTGVAGVGMSALAELLVGLGFQVQGSDRFADQGEAPPPLVRLRRLGVEILPQDGSGLQPGLAGMVYSSAIEETNPDVRAARACGVPMRHRADLLAELAAPHRVIAIAGTAGKTTVTGLVGWLLEQGGMDPTVVNGGGVLNWQDDDHSGSVRIGQSGLWVVEADESDRSLLRFNPSWATVTNISCDHFDLEDSVQLFREFRDRVHVGLVLGPEVDRLLGPDPKAGRSCIRLDDSSLLPEDRAVELDGEVYEVPLPGRHNRLNTLSALAICTAAGVSPALLRRSLATFEGVERRLQETGRGRGIRVWDDYAHNPAKLAAAWETAAEVSRRILGVWRPHGYGPLRATMDELEQAFVTTMRPDDRLYVLPVFDAGGTADRSVRSEDLVVRLKAGGAKVECVDDAAQLEERLLTQWASGDLLLVMGARDPGLSAFAHRMGRRCEGG